MLTLIQWHMFVQRTLIRTRMHTLIRACIAKHACRIPRKIFPKQLTAVLDPKLERKNCPGCNKSNDIRPHETEAINLWLDTREDISTPDLTRERILTLDVMRATISTSDVMRARISTLSHDLMKH